MNLPEYHFLPAPLWLITILHILTLTLHFVAMNFMVGGIVLLLFGKLSDRWNHPFVRQYLSLLPVAMAATVTLGVAPLLFVQLVYPAQIYAASIVSGWFWLMIVAVAILSYYLLYAASFSREAADKKSGFYLFLALLGFLYISFVYSSVFSQAEHPDLTRQMYAGTQSGLVLNPEVGGYIFRWLHMIFGAVTVGGFFVGLIGRDDETIHALGRRFFTGGMVITAVFGLIQLLTLGGILRPFMRSAAIGILTLAILLSAGSLIFYFRKSFLISGLLLFVSMFGMVTTRHFVRLLNLEGIYDPASYPIQPQWSVFILFLICFVAALIAIGYMLKIYFAGRGEPAAAE